MTHSPTYLGTVQDVQGSTVRVHLSKDTISGLIFIDGHGYRVGQVGSFVRIPIGFTDLFGIVSQVGAGAVPDTLVEVEPYGFRWITVQLIGEGQRIGEFRRGISQFPTINDEAHLVTNDDLAKIYGKPGDLNYVRVGSVASAESIPALIDANPLVTRHSAVLGTTGAGKSTTVASLLASLTDDEQFPSARVMILDIHGEYHSALMNRANVFRIHADTEKGEENLFVPYWALNFEELLRVTPFGGVPDADRAILAERIRDLKLSSIQVQQRSGVTSDDMTVDRPVPFSIHRLWYELHREVFSTHIVSSNSNQNSDTEALAEDTCGRKLLGNIMGLKRPQYLPIQTGGDNRVFTNGSRLNISRQLTALESLLRDRRYDFLFRPGPWRLSPDFQNLDAQPDKDLDALLESWIGAEKPITILDLSGVPEMILNDLIGVLLRLIYDALFWARYLPEGGRSRPLLVVLEEAHNYLTAGSAGLAAVTVRRIVKEGRKYGFGAMIVSQRPSEIDSTILSQCGTLFAMRLSNNSDRTFVTGVASDHLEGLFGMLPALRTGEAIIVGEAVNLPLRAVFDVPPINRRPDSNDPVIYDPDNKKGWNVGRRSEQYERVVENWRSENARNGRGDSNDDE